MNTLLLIILSTIFLLSTINGQSDEKPIICEGGEFTRSSLYTFLKNSFPERCNKFRFSYFIDMVNNLDSHIFESDINTIQQLRKELKSVYLYIRFLDNSDSWNKLLNNTDVKAQKYIDIFDPLKKMVKDLDINGIVIPIYKAKFKHVEDKLQMIIEDMKCSKSDLTVSLEFKENAFKYFTNKELFDFTKLNNIIEFYFISLIDLNTCNENTQLWTRNPVSSTNSSLITLEKVWMNMTCSTMDLKKTIATTQVDITYLESKNWNSYTEYCSMSETNKTSWCSDTSQTLYDQGQFVSKHFYGLSLTYICMDDYNTSCQCNKFPVSNIIIDGFLDQPLTICKALDGFND